MQTFACVLLANICPGQNCLQLSKLPSKKIQSILIRARCLNPKEMTASRPISFAVTHHGQMMRFNAIFSYFFRDLSNNQLSGISEGSFVELEKLEELDLAHNQISCIDQNALASLRSLRYL